MERAGNRAADVFANAAAIAHFEESRKRLRLANAAQCDLARLSEKLGGMFRVIAWYDEALEELEQAFAVYRAVEDLDGMARTAAQIGQAHFLRGARDEGIETLRAALAEVGGRMRADPSPGYVGLMLSLVEPLYDARRFEEALSVAEEAADAAHTLDDLRVRTLLELRRCRALQGTGRFEEARRTGEEARGSARLLGDLDSSARSLLWLGEISLAQGRAGEATALLQRALEVAETLGDLTLVAQALGRLGDAYTVSGEWDLARARYEAAVELVRSISYVYFSASTLLSLGDHYLLRGENERASRYLEEPLVLAERSGRSEQLPYLQIPLARWDVFHGTPEQALHRLQPLLEHPRFNSPEDHAAMQAAAAAYLQMGDASAAAALVVEGIAGASGHGNMLALSGWLLLKGQSGQITGTPDESETELRSALHLARQIPYPFLEARVLVSLGNGLRSRGNMKEGLPLLEQARAIFDGLGAAPYARRAREIIADFAAQPHV